MEFFQEYIVALIAAGCFCLGFILKHSFDRLPNKYIPAILAGVGVVLNCWLNGWTADVGIVVGGLASGLAGTGLFELGKNLLKGKQSDG